MSGRSAKTLFILIAVCPMVTSSRANAQTSQVYDICHGEYEPVCKEHPFNTFEPCGSPAGNNGADPKASVAYYCGTKPGGEANGSWGPKFPGHDGNKCGYAWFQVRCY
jgi:hypothetical protein